MTTFHRISFRTRLRPRRAQPAAATRLQWGAPGGVPEWPKGTGCKPVGLAYGGSNPPAPTTRDPRLVFVAIRVRDIAASAWFYREALGIPFESGQPPQPHAEVSWTDGAYLHLALFPPDPRPTENAEIGFFVDDVESAHARAVAAGAEIVREPRDEPWGRTGAYRDPDGNLVTLTEHPSALRVAGVDLASGGWAVVVLEENRVVDTFRCATFAEALLVDARIIEVDDYADEDERVIEVHPEVSFRELGHRPLLSKHRADGLAERRLLLEQAGIDLPGSVPRIAEPDLLDATVAAWSARRYALGEALPLPQGYSDRIGAIWR